MKNAAPYLRRKLYALMDGNITYNGNAVPVVESGSGTEGVTYQVFIGEYSDSDSSNKQNFGANATQVIEVVGEQKDSVKKHVDAIGELVMNLVKPTTQSDFLSDADFSINVLGKPSQNHLTETSEDGSVIVRLILRYSLLTIEN